MATDPEARATGSSAMMIGIIVLVLVVGLAVAYFTTNRTPEVAVVPGGGDTNTTVINPPDVNVQVPSGGSSDAGSSGGSTGSASSGTTGGETSGSSGTSEGAASGGSEK